MKRSKHRRVLAMLVPIILLGVVGVMLAQVVAPPPADEPAASDRAESQDAEAPPPSPAVRRGNAPAQANRVVRASDDPVEMVTLNFPGSVSLKTLVDYVSQRVGINFIYDEAPLGQRITMTSPMEIPRSSLYNLLTSVLRMKGLAIVDGEDGWKKIVPIKDAGVLTQQVDDAAHAAGASDLVTQVFQLTYLEPSVADQLIRPLLTTPGGSLIIVPGCSLLVVTDYADVLKKVAFLLSLADKQAEIAIRFIELKHARAEDVAAGVTKLIQKTESTGVAPTAPDARRTVRRRAVASQEDIGIIADPRINRIILVAPPARVPEIISLIDAFDAPVDVEFRTYQFTYITPSSVDAIIRELGGSERSLSLYKSVHDDKARKLFTVAPPDIHARIDSLKTELDIPDSATDYRQVKFYKLLNATAADVLSTLQSLDTGDVSFAELSIGKPKKSKVGDNDKFTGPNEPPSGAGETPPKPPAYRQRSSEGKAARSITTGSSGEDGEPVSVVAADENTNSIIVIAPPTVQAMYAELIDKLDKRRPQVMVEVTMVTIDTSDDFSLGVELMSKGHLRGDQDYLVFSSYGLSEVDPIVGSLAVQPGVGFNGAIVGPSTLNAVIKALATSSRAKVVASPRVLVNDNATATLTSVAEQPFTSINASDTVSTTSFGGYAEAGSVLTVTPHISEGDHLHIEYTITLNSFTGDSSEGIPAPRQTNELTSEVTVPDGFAIIGGGLKRKDVRKSNSRIPLLGDIPLLGKAFSLEDNSERENTLFVFIRPIIMRDDEFEDLKYFSDRDLKRAGMPLNLPDSLPMLMR